MEKTKMIDRTDFVESTATRIDALTTNANKMKYCQMFLYYCVIRNFLKIVYKKLKTCVALDRLDS